MNHMARDKIYHLAELVTQDLAYTESDVTDMRHIGECEDCYKKLRIAIALMDAVDNAGLVSLTSSTTAHVAIGEKVRAVLRLVVGKVNTLLEQLDVQTSTWTFDTPLSMAGARSSDDSYGTQTLEDVEHSQTFIAYDPVNRMLAIQVECPNTSSIPTVLIKEPNGSSRSISFTKREHLLWAEVSNLTEGEYEIVLEK